MKITAALIITISLVLGMIASTTAYVPKLDAIGPDQAPTLNAPAGRSPEDPTQPRITPGEPDVSATVDEAMIDQLQEDGEQRVRVKEFAWSRWSHRWYFVLSCAGLLVGAVLFRRAQRTEVGQPSTHEAQPVNPGALLDDTLARLQQLQREVDQAHDLRQRFELILSRLDELHDATLEPFVNARAHLVARFGMSGYAQIMDLFAAAERQTNRAWSAAADNVDDEARACLQEAVERFQLARSRLQELSGNARS